MFLFRTNFFRCLHIDFKKMGNFVAISIMCHHFCRSSYSVQFIFGALYVSTFKRVYYDAAFIQLKHEQRFPGIRKQKLFLKKDVLNSMGYYSLLLGQDNDE